jgi:hypothetical protein
MKPSSLVYESPCGCVVAFRYSKKQLTTELTRRCRTAALKMHMDEVIETASHEWTAKLNRPAARHRRGG